MRLFLLLLIISFGVAKEAVLYTSKAKATYERVDLKGPFSLEYDKIHLEGKKGSYQVPNSKVDLGQGIEILEREGINAAAVNADVQLRKKRFRLHEFFASEQNSSLWIRGSRLEGNESKITLEKAFISSCEVGCSDWKFFFSSGSLDRLQHWVNLYNITLYAKNTPVFYFPYIGFSTLKKRHTGLLRPTIGLSDKEGFIYIQPFYYAPAAWWDLEFDPEIRSKRGKGLYATFRFVDSPSSFGSVRTGLFRENSAYFDEQRIKNLKHYGLEIFYRRDKLFSGNESDDGIYLDSKSYNDVDYFYLQKHRRLNNISSIIISRLNYYYQKDRDYFGFYAKYFKDNRKIDNSDTLQILPSLQYHRYLRSVFNDKISYLVDAQISHYYRQKGLNAIEYRYDMPIRFYTHFLNGALGFSITENLNARYADYNFVDKHLNKKWKNYSIYRNSHEITLFSDLVRSYGDLFHTLHLEMMLNIPSFEKERGERAPFIDVENQDKRLTLSLKHYFYKDGHELFYHRLSQPFVYDYPHKAKELENEFGMRWRDLWFNCDTFYSHQRGKFTTIVSQLDYDDGANSLALTHFYKDRLEGLRNSNFLRLDGVKNLSKKYKLFATIDYDFVDNRTKSWSFGWQMDSKCWSYMLSYKQDVVPVLASSGSDSYNNNVIYFRIEFYPLGGVSRSISKIEERRTF